MKTNIVGTPEGIGTKALPIGIVSGRFNSDNNEENEKALTAILYKHTNEKEMKIREVDYEEVVKDIMEYF
jgi:hypothetical protein